MMHHPDIYVAHSEGKGRGVFAGSLIENGDIIEVSPVIVLPNADKDKIHDSFLHDYYFLWGKDLRELAIALGYGSLYNHSDTPNASFSYDYNDRSITFNCIHRIEAGTEICINYNEGKEKDLKLWF